MGRRGLLKKIGSGFDFQNDMKGYWRFTVNGNDYSGNNHHASDVGTTDFSGGFAALGSGSRRIVIPSSTDFSFTDGVNDTPFTIAYLMRWNNKTGDFQFLISRRSQTGANVEYQANSVAAGNEWNFSITNHNSVSNNIKTSIPMIDILASSWHSIIYTYDGSKTASGFKAYLDGVISASPTIAAGFYKGMTAGISDIIIGTAGWNTTYPFMGDLKDLTIWKNREMTLAEVDEIDRRVKAGEPLV